MKRITTRICALALAAGLLAGCGAQAPSGAAGDGQLVGAGDLFAQVQSRYQENELVDYGEPITELARGAALDFVIGFDPAAVGVDNVNQIFDMFYDAELTQRVLQFPAYDKENKTITLRPPTDPAGRIAAFTLTTEQVALYPHTSSSLFGRDIYTDWGNVGKMYLAQYRDLETGTELEKPLVRVVTVKGELEAPKVEFQPTENGLAAFRWNAVEGATAYAVFRVSYDSGRGPVGGAEVLGLTQEPYWRQQAPLFGNTVLANEPFRSFKYSENDWAAGNVYDAAGAAEGEVVPQDHDYRYGVMALNDQGTSMFSNLFTRQELAANLPYSLAYAVAKENGFSTTTDDIGLAPSHAWVEMCDGTTARKAINYNTDQAQMVLKRYVSVDETSGEYIEGQDVPVLQIPYTIDGAPLEGTLIVTDYDEENLEKDLKVLSERQASLRQQAGGRAVSAAAMGTDGSEPQPDDAAAAQVRLPSAEIKITANSALSEYLATCMLSQTSLIDISKYPGCGDADAVEDALLEAYYQNPLIFGLKSYRINRKGTTLMLAYDETPESGAKKQQEVRTKVSQIIAEIIQPGMTELEKEFAINQYLCDTIEYDMAALENAEANNYQYTDEAFNDSFTAYGALINGKCVCAGYAAAMKLLCEEAGLECIVTTGMLEGQLSHAWNKVKIDGEWQVVDTTNNDNEELFNVLLNLPQAVSRGTLVEDKRYMLDSALDAYKATGGDYEYYRVEEKYFPVSEIAAALAKELKENGKAVLRTDYDLTDSSFQTVAQQVYTQLDSGVKLSGYFWMGVIYLEKV